MIENNLTDGTELENGENTGYPLLLQTSAIGSDDTIYVTDPVNFSGNLAQSGGAIYNENASLGFADATFSGNTASKKGGAIYNTGTFCFAAAIFSGNTAGNGGAIYNGGTISVAGSATFTGNVASSGGAISNTGGTVNLQGSVTLATANDTWLNIKYGSRIAVTNWDISGVTDAQSSTVCIHNFEYFSNKHTADEGQEKLTITVSADQAQGVYTIATGALNAQMLAANNTDTFYLTTDGSSFSGALTVGTSGITYAGNSYSLALASGKLVLTCGQRPAVSDYNKSGKSDMVQFVNGLVYVTHDTDSGYVQTPAINDVTGWEVTEIRRDLTGDGYADIQITSDDGAGSTWVATLRNDYLSTGCITLNYQFIGAYDNQLWSYLGSADFNGDGKSEILMVQTEAGKDQYGHRNVAGWVTDSTTCQWIDNIWLGALNDGWNIAGTADVTGDGKDNLILRGADGMIGYWAEFGGQPEDIVELKNAGNRVLLTTGDFDGDGAADFLWRTIGGDEFSVWSDLNGAFTDNAIGKESDLGGSWSFAGVGDYNGDGKDEILWCDTTTYKTAYSEGNKANFTQLTIIA